ncbi:hypothetical protein [Kitasatospora paranensis]|uniref:Uncharacterized protein n=1 Tax=Kitasatospora paranensis TaxID=258053 RepID=A0ABW2FWG9_9ACTN
MRGCRAAAVAGIVLPATFLHVAAVARAEALDPVIDPADPSPGAGSMAGTLVMMPLGLLAAVLTLIPVGLWLVAAVRLRRRPTDSAGIAFMLSMVAALFALPFAATVPFGWLDALGVLAAEAVGLRALLLTRRVRPVPVG